MFALCCIEGIKEVWQNYIAECRQDIVCKRRYVGVCVIQSLPETQINKVI